MRIPAVALALAVVFASPATAAKPQLTDPVGDLLPVYSAGYDVVSATFTTNSVRPKGARTSTPVALVVTVTYAGPVPTDVHAAQSVVFTAPTCGVVYLGRWSGGTHGHAECGKRFTPHAVASGNSVTFTLPVASVGAQHLRRGTRLHDLRTYTAVAEPRSGYESGELMDAFGFGPVDSTRGRATYTMG